MSYKYWKHDVEEVRKVHWDGLWHVVFKSNNGINGQNYDRVTQKEAMYVAKMMNKWRHPKKKREVAA